ncbi:putative acyltransferase [Leptolyngbya sp. NIES-3755]|nr:putative acyltransferase [Leptolyngbya sp. NIES-3755]
MNSPVKSSSNRFLELDVLRGIAAFSVVLFHYTSQYATLFQHSSALGFYFAIGRHGVELFFMISGFVILMSIERTKRGLDFVVGRVARLYPAYWIAIALTSSVMAIAQVSTLQVKPIEILINLTMIQGFFKLPHVDDVYWTLQLELCFYGLMFAVYRLQWLKQIEKVVVVWVSIAAYLAFKTYTARWGAIVEVPEFSGSVGSMPLMIAGGKLNLVAELREFFREAFLFKYAHLFTLGIVLYRVKQTGLTWQRGATIAVCILMQKIAYSSETSWETTGFVAAFVVVFYLAIQGYLKWICVKPLIFLGTISYSLYLVHQNIGYAMIRSLYQINVNPNLSILMTTIAMMLIATGITFGVERPALKWIRDRYELWKLHELNS